MKDRPSLIPARREPEPLSAVPCACNGSDPDPYCPRHTTLPGEPSSLIPARRDDAATYDSLLAADHAASVAHDFIWGKNAVTQQQASAAIWTIHNALRPLIVLDGDDVAGNLEGDLREKLRNEDDAALRNYLAKPKGIDE